MRIDEVQPHTPFEVRDFWATDAAFRQTLARQVSLCDADSASSRWPELAARIAAVSRSVQEDARPLARLCERPGAKPRLVQFDEWGRRVDLVETNEGWRGLLEWQARHGIVGEAFTANGQEDVMSSNADADQQAAASSATHAPASASAGGRDRLGPLARLYAFARIFTFSPDCQVSLCPTSMSDGAIRVLELYGTPQQQQRFLPKLLSRDFSTQWQSGQWMTEVAGGSDVSMTETVARPLVTQQAGQKGRAGDLYAIYGFKWFSSAVDGHMSLALARTNPDRSKGSRGLSLFLIPLKRTDRSPIPTGAQYVDEVPPTSPYNGIKVHRLKNKLGTQLVPTAELELCGAVGELIGEEGRGVAQIAQVLNITRVYTANGSVSSTGRALQIIQSYSARRRVGAAHSSGGGKQEEAAVLLRDLPMHNALVSSIAITYRALLQLMWSTTTLLGKNEVAATPPSPGVGVRLDAAAAHDARRLRLLTPALKAFASVRASECLAQSIECMGGQGYMEENELTRLLRDDMVGRIWEGTPSVLSLDVARVHAQSKGVVLQEWIDDALASLQQSQQAFSDADAASSLVHNVVHTLTAALADVGTTFVQQQALIPGKAAGRYADIRLARALLDLVAIVECGCQLLCQAAWTAHAPAPYEHGSTDLELHVAHRWVCGAEGRLAAARNQLATLVQGGAQQPDLDRVIAYDDVRALPSFVANTVSPRSSGRLEHSDSDAQHATRSRM